ncbi:MAG TPA: apolipoprotein N-acyltransferase [Pyrinomonadaceae bacterium]|nr:apolipoprotein N-acyltransferase [Pyrinomonadaceae bacterium]
MKLASLKNIFPSISNAGLAFLSAVLLILAFPDFEFSILAWFALVPLFFAIECEKEFWRKSFFTGWIFGTVFFFGTCYWLTFAPITYAGFPAPIAYILMFFVALAVGLFPAIFGAIFSILLKRFGNYAILSAPFLWVFTEFLRYHLTGNNWNAIGYSQAFLPFWLKMALPIDIQLASIGGVYLVGFFTLLISTILTFFLIKKRFVGIPVFILIIFLFGGTSYFYRLMTAKNVLKIEPLVEANVVAIQPNVPMNGLTYEKYEELLTRHVELAESALKQRTKNDGQRTTVVFPESPMIFQYGRDRDLQKYLKDFAVRNNVSVLFNSAETAPDGNRPLNSAVMINERGEKTAQYDKIHLLPFGEFIPFPEPIASQMPAFVGNFEFGNEYDLLEFGEARGGVMICFESHFGELSREYTKRGADVLIEMTNDGYLGNTPVLRQHLANSVFRAVETNRPLLRVTNVGITAYINERGKVSDAAEVYQEATRVWTISKSDGNQTIYVKYGDWFAWLCSIVSLALLFLSFRKKKINENANTENFTA